MNGLLLLDFVACLDDLDEPSPWETVVGLNVGKLVVVTVVGLKVGELVVGFIVGLEVSALEVAAVVGLEVGVLVLV